MDRSVRGPWVVGVVVLAAALAGCGGGSDSGRTGARPGAYDGPETAAVGAFTLAAPQAGAGAGHIYLQWTPAPGAVRYTVQMSARAGAEFVDAGVAGTADTAFLNPAPTWALDWPTARVRVRGCDAADSCTDSNAQPLAEALAASRPSLSSSDMKRFAISDDGRTVATLRPTDMGMFGEPPYNWGPSLVSIVENRDGFYWGGTAQLPPPMSEVITGSMALSGDGNTLAVSLAYPYFGDSFTPGSIVVYRRYDRGDYGMIWRLQAVVTPPPELGAIADLTGLVFSDDGRRLAALSYVGPSTAVLVFERGADDGWRYHSSVAADPYSPFALSGNGQLIAVVQRAGTVDVPVPPGATAALDYHVVRLHRCQGTVWQPAGELRSDGYPYADAAASFDDFGLGGLAISDDGLSVAVGAPRQRVVSSAGGAVFVFNTSTQAPDRWTTQGKLVIEGGARRDLFGLNLSLSGNGRVLAVSRCSRVFVADGVARAYPVSPPPPNDPRCGIGDPGSAEGDTHAAHVFRHGATGAWAEASVVVPPTPATSVNYPPSRFDRDLLLPGLDHDGRTLAIAVRRDAQFGIFEPGGFGLLVY